MAKRLSQAAYRKPKDKKNRIIFIVGPTAVGKTAASAILAGKINAEIVSCDSMQVYQGMDILASWPPPVLRKKIRHHLIGIIPAQREYDVSRYRKEALKKTRDIIKRGKVPLFVGGTGLYLSTLLDGIFDARVRDKSIRQKLYQEAQKLGSIKLHARLKQVDPAAALKIHPNDTRRIIRALEVFESTGKPISCLQKQRKGLVSKYEVVIFCLNMERSKLYQRIAERTEKMFSRGLIPQAQRLLKSRLSRTASYAIGLKELKGCFDGLYDVKEAKRLIQRNTCLYAKRQLTWFRKDKRIIWLNVASSQKPSRVANRLFRRIKLYLT